jgi:ParB family chromosome partitioning protein
MAKNEKKPRDYERETFMRNQRKQKAKEAADQGAGEQPTQERKGLHPDLGQCGHIDIALSQIISDPNQPRKFFDMAELLSLSQSIIQYGVIEPILVRPIPGDLYMVVFGDRRFRASLMAADAHGNLATIPAMIRELTDDEALELQITENLQRHDPHPIEEAHAFKLMLAKHDVKEIALRVGKSDKFVANRLMLNDLAPCFQEVFFANKMSLGQAVVLCKIQQEAQEAIFEDEVPANWKQDEDFLLDSIGYLVDRELKNLDSAPFKTEDAELYPEMGACGSCKYNSRNNLSLFIDENESRVCGLPVCYNIKCSRSYKNTIEEVMTDPSVVFVSNGHYSESDKQKVKEVEKMGVPVLPPGSWRRVADIQKPDWDKHLAGCEWAFDPESQTREEFEASCREEYNEDVKEYEERIKEIEAARAEGKVRKAFVVVGMGNTEGAIIEIMPTTAQGEIALATGEEAADLGVAHQIAEIEKREVRAKELDSEKVWQSVREAMINSNHFSRDDNFDDGERSVFAAAIYDAIGWQERKGYAIDVLKLKDYDDNMEVAAALEKITDEQFNILCRIFMKTKLFPLPGSHLTSYVNYMGHALAKIYMPNQVADIEANQNVKAKKRAENVKKKIQDLKDPPPPKEKRKKEEDEA